MVSSSHWLESASVFHPKTTLNRQHKCSDPRTICKLIQKNTRAWTPHNVLKHFKIKPLLSLILDQTFQLVAVLAASGDARRLASTLHSCTVRAYDPSRTFGVLMPHGPQFKHTPAQQRTEGVPITIIITISIIIIIIVVCMAS